MNVIVPAKFGNHLKRARKTYPDLNPAFPTYGMARKEDTIIIPVGETNHSLVICEDDLDTLHQFTGMAMAWRNENKNRKAMTTEATSTLSFSELRSANVARCEEVFHPISEWSPTDWATAMAGECGEACNEVKKLRRLDHADSEFDSPEQRELIKQKIALELADLVIYADLLSARLGIDLGYAVTVKFNQVSAKRSSTHFIHAKGGQK